MKQNFVRVWAATALIILISGSASPVALAASSNNPAGAFNVVLAPVTQNLEVKPGGSVSTDLKIENQSLDTEHIKVTLERFEAHGQDGTPLLKGFGAGDDYANWVTFSQTNFDVGPNLWKSIKMTINPPKTAAFGYYYAVVFSREGQSTQKNQANLLGAAASLVLLDVKAPGAVRHADIIQFSTDRKSYEFLPANFTVRMHNTGNVHVAPRGNIDITKGGKNVALLEVNLAKGNILPGSYRVFNAVWQDGTPAYKVKTVSGKTVLDAKDKPVSELNWSNYNMSRLRFGKYDAKLIMVYNDGEGDFATEAHLSFWVIPWRIIAGTLVVLILIAGGLWTFVIRPARSRLSRGRKYDR